MRGSGQATADQVRAVLLECPLLLDAWVTGEGDDRTAYVVPLAGADSLDPDTATQRHVREWGLVFDHRYRGRLGELASDPFAGWHSAYTGEPLAAADMREWQAASVERVLELRPRRVLELGCGTGLVATGLLDRCDLYCGTDCSPAATARLAERLRAAGRGAWPLRTQPAHDLSGLPGGFDTVVLNSVAQYFPSWSYLLGVLTGAADLVPGPGHLFVGDVRSLPLGGPYHLSVALAQLGPREPAGAVRRWIDERVEGEPELLVHPAAFLALTRVLARASHVTVRPRRGRIRNEMTCFRYDVVIHLDEPPPAPAAARRVRNGRVEPFADAWRALRDAAPDAPLETVRAAIAGRPGVGVDPEDLWAAGAEVHLDPAGDGAGLLVLERGARGSGICAHRVPGEPVEPAVPASSPLEHRTGRRRRDLARRVRAFLAGRLPEAATMAVVPVVGPPGLEV